MALHHVRHQLDAGQILTHAYNSLLVRGADAEVDPGFIPKPITLPDDSDFGMLANLTSAAAPFTHGLNGVNQELNYVFAIAVGFSLVGLCVATLLIRCMRLANNHVRFLLTLNDKGGQRYWARNQTKWWPWLKRHVLYAPLFRVRHNKELQLSSAVSIGTLPSRFHTLLLMVYVISNIAYCFVLGWHHKSGPALLAEVRGRTGELATINLIPTVLFALRNNPLIPLLRVSYDTFNLFHRWCARAFVLQSLAHTIVFAINTVNAGGPDAFIDSLRTSISFTWGMVATCVLVLMFIIAMSPIRHAFYEVFINLHRILALLSIVGVYIHIERANLPQVPYIRAVFALWGAEWAARMYKIIYYNLSFRKGMTAVTVEALPAEACRVTFHLARPWRFVPGAHVHIYLPSISGWSSHPFSIAWAETTTTIPAMGLDLEKLPPYTLDKSSETSKAAVPEVTMVKTEVDLRSVPNSKASTSVSLVVRARTGMTQKLYKRASASPGGRMVIRGGIEGPYGGHEPLTSYGTVILFAGGVGITHCLSYIKDLLTKHAEGTCSARRVLLVWSLPNTEALEWVRPWMDQVLRMEGRKEILCIQLFVTKPRHQNEIRSNTGRVNMFPGRCNPTTIIEKEMLDRVGATGVVVCGPGAFADSVRAATRAHVEAGSLDFIEEAFTY